MTEQRIPQRGLPKPPSKYPITPATAMTEHITRQPGGTYRVSYSKENRCCQFMQIGAARICVMDDYGYLVTIAQEPNPWY